MDPNLEAALKEIEEVLKKHDCAGIVHLASQSNNMYLHFVSPSWSCAKVEVAGDKYGIRIKAVKEDFTTPEEHKKVLSDTVGMILGFAHVARVTENQMLDLAKAIGKVVQITHWDRDE